MSRNELMRQQHVDLNLFYCNALLQKGFRGFEIFNKNTLKLIQCAETNCILLKCLYLKSYVTRGSLSMISVFLAILLVIKIFLIKRNKSLNTRRPTFTASKSRPPCYTDHSPLMCVCTRWLNNLFYRESLNFRFLLVIHFRHS